MSSPLELPRPWPAAPALPAHDPRAARRAAVLLALAVAVPAAALACAAIGSVSIPLRAIAFNGLSPQQQTVLWAIRVPRVALAVVVGAGLGVSGASMQGIFRNPLADPSLLGVSSGAALGAASAIVLGRGLPSAFAPYAVTLCGFAGALGALLMVHGVSRMDGRSSVAVILLAGIAANALCGALTGVLTYVADDAQLRTLTFWSLGSLGGASWRVVALSAPFVALPALALPRLARALNALLLGDADAGALGFEVERVKQQVIVLVAIAVGASVAVTGVLGFVGLVVPHLVRLAAGPDHRGVLPGSALLGALLLLAADAVARTAVAPAELPLGVVTACLGAPFFLYLLLRERRRLT